MHKHASLNIDVAHTQELSTHTQMCSRMHSIKASCFASEPERSPSRPWCHWWGHLWGHQQHSEGPPRAAANYEVMDQHANLICSPFQLVPDSSLPGSPSAGEKKRSSLRKLLSLCFYPNLWYCSLLSEENTTVTLSEACEVTLLV